MNLTVFKTLIFCVLAIKSLSVLAQQDTLVVRVPGENFPISFKHNEQWQGMDIDILNALMDKTGLSYKVIIMPLKRALNETQKGHIDIIPNLAKNKSRSEFMNWMGPSRYTSVGLVVLEKNKNVEITNISNLIAVLDKNKQQLGYLMGASYSDELDKRLETDHKLKSLLWHTASFGQYYTMLRNDRIFGFLHDDFEAQSLIFANKQGEENEFKGFALNNFRVPGSAGGAYFALSKTLKPRIQSQLQSAFGELVSDGTLGHFYDKWAGE